MQLNIKKLHPDSIIPKYAHETDSGADLCSVEDLIIEPGDFAIVGTGIALELPVGLYVHICSRSGLAAKFGVAVLNSPGIIDAGYRGEIKVILINHGKEPFPVLKGMRIAQMVIAPVTKMELVNTEELTSSDRGVNGLGSTGH